jgi:hypothetical protein
MVSHSAYILYAPADPEVQPRLKARCRSLVDYIYATLGTKHLIYTPSLACLSLSAIRHSLYHCSRCSRDGSIRLTEKGIGMEERERSRSGDYDDTIASRRGEMIPNTYNYPQICL